MIQPNVLGYAPKVMRYVAPGLYPAIRGSTPRGRTRGVISLRDIGLRYSLTV